MTMTNLVLAFLTLIVTSPHYSSCKMFDCGSMSSENCMLLKRLAYEVVKEKNEALPPTCSR